MVLGRGLPPAVALCLPGVGVIYGRQLNQAVLSVCPGFLSLCPRPRCVRCSG